MFPLVILIIVFISTNCALQSISEKKCQEFYPSSDRLKKFKEPSKGNYLKAALDELPYIVLIGYHDNNKTTEYSCDATLISNRYVVAAGHCVTPLHFPSQVFSIATGKQNNNPKSPAKEVIPVERIIRHPDYDGLQIYHEIALLQLGKNSTQRPACLWTRSIKIGMKANLIVYARDTIKKYDELAKIRTQIFSTRKCSKYYGIDIAIPRGISNNFLFCAWEKDKRDYNLLLSRGPLIIQKKSRSNWIPYLIGMGSLDTEVKDAPVVYMKIAAFISWIESVIWADE